MRGKAILLKIRKITAGGFHCWCDSDVGIIRKPNYAVPEALWDVFYGRPKKIDYEKDKDFAAVIPLRSKVKLKWWQKLWYWFLGLIQKLWRK